MISYIGKIAIYFTRMYGTVLELAAGGISDRLLNLMCPQDVQH